MLYMKLIRFFSWIIQNIQVPYSTPILQTSKNVNNLLIANILNITDAETTLHLLEHGNILLFRVAKIIVNFFLDKRYIDKHWHHLNILETAFFISLK